MIRMIPKWGHWFWITALLSCSEVASATADPTLKPISAEGGLGIVMIVTPSSVIKQPPPPRPMVSMRSLSPKHAPAMLLPNDHFTQEGAAGNENKSNQKNDVSMSQSVSVVSVKFSSSDVGQGGTIHNQPSMDTSTIFIPFVDNTDSINQSSVVEKSVTVENESIQLAKNISLQNQEEFEAADVTESYEFVTQFDEIYPDYEVSAASDGRNGVPPIEEAQPSDTEPTGRAFPSIWKLATEQSQWMKQRTNPTSTFDGTTSVNGRSENSAFFSTEITSESAMASSSTIPTTSMTSPSITRAGTSTPVRNTTPWPSTKETSSLPTERIPFLSTFEPQITSSYAATTNDHLMANFYKSRRENESAKYELSTERSTDYEQIPKVVVGYSEIFTGASEDDRDEEPFARFMAEEGRSLSFDKSEYADDIGSKGNDDLIPSYDEHQYQKSSGEEALPRVLISSAHRDHPHQMHYEEPHVTKPTTIDITTVAAITVGALLFILIGIVGVGFFIYHEKYANKPRALEERYSSTDSEGSVEDQYRRISHIDCIGFDMPRDTFNEEMYNLDNDYFLNSLEAATIPSYWTSDSAIRNQRDSDL